MAQGYRIVNFGSAGGGLTAGNEAAERGIESRCEALNPGFSNVRPWEFVRSWVVRTTLLTPRPSRDCRRSQRHLKDMRV